MKTTTRYSPEFRQRAVRMVFEHQGEHKTQWAAIVSIASKIGCTGETLRKWVTLMSEAEYKPRLQKSGGNKWKSSNNSKEYRQRR